MILNILLLFVLFVLVIAGVELWYQRSLAEIYKDAYEQAQSGRRKLFEDKE